MIKGQKIKQMEKQRRYCSLNSIKFHVFKVVNILLRKGEMLGISSDSLRTSKSNVYSFYYKEGVLVIITPTKYENKKYSLLSSN